MNLATKIKRILDDSSLNSIDKLIEISNCLPKVTPSEFEMGELFGQTGQIRKDGNTVVFDGGYGKEYIDNPRLKNPDDLFYTGFGPKWGIDLDEKRYYKRYHISITKSDRYNHLNHLDIIDEKARIKKLVLECLNELGF